MSVYTGKYRKRLPRLTGTELELYRANPTREEELGITDYVVCRDCGMRPQYIGTEHLKWKSHSSTLRAYGEKWPGAPTYSPLAKAKRLEIQRKWVARQNSEQLREYKHAEYIAHREERIAAATAWQNEHRDSHLKFCANWRASERGKKLTRLRKQRWQAKMQELRERSERGHRQREDATALRILELQAQKPKKNWSQITDILNRERFKTNKEKYTTVGAYKKLLRRYRRRNPARRPLK